MFQGTLKFIFLFLFGLFFVVGCNSTSSNSSYSISDNSSGNTGDNASYTVSFNSNGGAGEMKSVTVSGGKYKLPLNTYYYEGYNFIGWSNSSNGELLYGDGEEIEVSSNITLYALWQEESSSGVETYYTITFDSNGGDGVMESQSALQGKRVQITLNSFLKNGYSFTGWSLSNSNIPYYSNGDYITVNSDITLYACWKDDSISTASYTVYFNGNNGDGYMPPLKVNGGETFELTSNIFTRAGFAFEGWSLTENGEVAYKDGASLSINSDIELFAVWKSVPFYNITFHSNNGKDEVISVSFPSNVMPVKLPDNTFQNGSKKFTGWTTSDNSVSYIDGCDVVYLTGDLDLYASWSDNPVKITFDAFNGKDEYSIIYAMAGSVINLPKAEFTRNGYELLGSYTCYVDEIYGGVHRFGVDYTVPSDAKEIVFSVGWRELPKPPTPAFGGNSDKYKNQYVLVKGVNMTKKDWIESLTPGLFYGVWNVNAGWYDSSQWRYNLCWAGTSSNMLHWWYDRNKENIEKYYAHYASDEVVNNKPSSKYYGEGVSDIFIIFRDHWKDAGYLIEIGLEWYIFGTHYNKNGGGYFKEVFLEEDVPSVIEEYSGITQYTFNTNINKAFDNGMAVGLAEVNGFGSHAITLWGVHYDDEGLIDGVIVADSGTRSGNNAPTGYDTGLIYMNIIYDNFGKPFMTNSYGSRLPLTKLVLLGDGAEQWKKYFDTHEPIR